MNQKTTNFILLGMMAGVLLGGLLGYVWPQALLATEFIGTLFLNSLKVIIIPLIVASMIVGVTSMGDVRKVGRTGLQVIGYFLVTTVIAVTIGLILVNIIEPGAGVDKSGGFMTPGMENAQERSITDIFETLVPDNLIKAMAEGKFLGIIIFSLVFGGVLTTLGSKADTITNFFRELNQVVMKMVFLILYVAPIGLFSVVGTIVAKNSDSIGQLGSSLFWYGFTLVIGLAIHAFVVLPLILKFFAGRSPLQYAANMLPAFATAIGTSSSSATLPVTYKCVVDKNKVDQRAGQFVLPLGTTVNMDGSAMYVVIATIFIAQVYGEALSFLDMIMIGITAVLVSIGAAGIPSAALFMLAIVFSVAGFRPEAYAGVGLILAVDWLLDRCRTTVNVWGDSIGAAVIGESFEFKTARRQPAARTSRTPRRPTGTSRTGSTDRSSGTRRSSTGTTRRSGKDTRPGRPARTTRATSGSPRAATSRSRKKPAKSETNINSELSPFDITETGAPVLDFGVDSTSDESKDLTGSGKEASSAKSRPGRRTATSFRPGRKVREKPVQKPPNDSSADQTESGNALSDTPARGVTTVSNGAENQSREKTARITPDAAARNLAALTAQLGTERRQPAADKPVTTGQAATTETSPPGVVPDSRPEQPPTESRSTTDSTAESETSTPSFGRTASRKRPERPERSVASSDQSPSTDSSTNEESKPTYNQFETDNISFGRKSKKKGLKR